jgi:alanine racemase
MTATIHIDSMQHNLARARRLRAGAKVWGVVKANAYGHGLERGMRGFADADGLALIETDNALRLRELGWTKPIVLLEGFSMPGRCRHCRQEHGIQSRVHCDEQLACWKRPGGPDRRHRCPH